MISVILYIKILVIVPLRQLATRKRLTLFVTACLLFSSHSSLAKEVVLAYLENGLSELKNNEKQVALQLLANELVRDNGLHITIKPISTFSEIQHLITEKKIDYAIFNSFHYLSHSDFFQKNITDPIWSIQRGPLNKERFILISNTQNAKTDFSQFQNKAISLHQNYLLMNLYLTYLTKQSSDLSPLHFFKKIKHTKTASQAILDVYFGVSDLCIVPNHIYGLTVELNPAIQNKLIIMHKSEQQFIPVLIFGFKHVDIAVRSIINAKLTTFGDTARTQQILDLFKIQAVKPIDEKQLQPMLMFFQNHQALH